MKGSNCMRLFGFLFATALTALGQNYSNVQTMPVVGIAGGQAARLNLLNVGGQGQTAECLVILLFLDDQGALLKNSTVAALPGRSVFLDLTADTDLGLGATDRRQVHAIWAHLATRSAPVCTLAPTLEIFDRSTGRTSIVITNSTPIPQPPPPATQP